MMRGGGEISGERRADRRYEVKLAVRWALVYRRRVLDSGDGITVDLSSGGILFETDRQLPVGRNITLSIAWPTMLNQATPLQLRIDGLVIRTAGRRVAARIERHEFRTAGGSN
jgi:PilZ domain-containing protein